MSESVKHSDVSFEKYCPQHPLPNEIKQLDVKETICQFCGISYLIHSEIKRLEEEIISLNKKLKEFEQLSISEKKYENQCNDLSTEIENLRFDFATLKETLTKLKSDRDLYQTQNIEKEDKIMKLDTTLSILKVDKNKLLNSQNLFIRHLYDLQKNMRIIKDDFSSSKKEIINLFVNNQSDYSVFTSKIKTTIQHIKDFYLLECHEYQDEAKKLTAELLIARKRTKETEREISQFVSKTELLSEKNRSLIQENSQLEHQLSDKICSLSQKDEIIQILKQEIDNLTSSKNKNINEIKNEIIKMKLENKCLEQSLEGMKQENEKFKLSSTLHETDVQRLSGVILEKNQELDEYRDAVTQGDILIKNYVQQIESMNKERETQALLHNTEVTKFLKELKAKAKYSEILKTELEESHKRRISEKDDEIRELQDYKKVHQQKLDDEIRERENLQKCVINIENENKRLLQKLKELQINFDFEKGSISKKSEEKEKSLQELEKEIFDKENLIDKMEDDLIKKNNEITNLKQMVQKECEERYELTEALNQAREQLLLMGDFHVSKVSNNLPPINPIKSNSSSASENRSSKLSIKEKRNSFGPLSGNPSNSVISTKRKLERLFNA